MLHLNSAISNLNTSGMINFNYLVILSVLKERTVKIPLSFELFAQLILNESMKHD